jgi:hypothetical protein
VLPATVVTAFGCDPAVALLTAEIVCVPETLRDWATAALPDTRSRTTMSRANFLN